MNMAEQLRSFLRLKQVKSATGMSRSWLYEAIRRGEFPAPISIGRACRSVGFSGHRGLAGSAHCRRLQESQSSILRSGGHDSQCADRFHNRTAGSR
ncbi:MAG: AlpA family phage regulatory protein [Candidatus Accumulibacter necessarius]|uniref:helix-turn-helix transcriptional regulator n=1 Tax=Candidatus Accumulibacter necessarius TaxID=2954386 RepID=UPI002FC36F31